MHHVFAVIPFLGTVEVCGVYVPMLSIYILILLLRTLTIALVLGAQRKREMKDDMEVNPMVD